MPSSYLTGGDLAAYGVPSATAAQIAQASGLIDAHLRRPEGLIWSPDGKGNPCFMAALAPQYTFTLSAPIVPGQNVVCTVTGPVASLGTGGQGLVLDRDNAAATEAVSVLAVNGNQITLASVSFAHPQGAKLEFGLLIYEERQMPADRPITRLSRLPALTVVAGQGRYGYARKGDQNRYMVDEYNLLASMTHFGGPPVWVAIDMRNAGVMPGTGELWVPAGILLAYYSQVRVYYVAGFPAAALPNEIKQACAAIITSITQASFPASLKSVKAGDSALQRFSDTVIDGEIRSLLAPHKARVWS